MVLNFAEGTWTVCDFKDLTVLHLVINVHKGNICGCHWQGELVSSEICQGLTHVPPQLPQTWFEKKRQFEKKTGREETKIRYCWHNLCGLLERLPKNKRGQRH